MSNEYPTVEELIAKLEKCPKKATVMIAVDGRYSCPDAVFIRDNDKDIAIVSFQVDESEMPKRWGKV